MRSVLLAVIALCVVGALAPNIAAQDIESTSFIPAQITVTPHVTPPKEAVESGLGGTVRVKISIDAAGSVTSADDAVGPDLTCRQVTRADVVAMRDAAKAAALTARFNPATDKGVPVASSTWLNFKFPGTTSVSSYSAVGVKGDANSDVVKGPEPKMTMVPSTIETAGASAPPPDYKGPVAAAPVKGGIPKQINGGIVNGKATSLPKPAYPAAARAVRAEGAVSVQVLIDEDGSVFTAQAIAGHPLLRAASAAAACESRFSPTQLSGNPVRVSGVITYNFVP